MALTSELVAQCHRVEPDPGPWPGYQPFADADYDAAAGALLKQKPPGPLWVFAYGSLLWKPAFDPVEQRRATAHGWHRAFTLELKRWRGSPQQPGLMMALERGGRCDGVVYRLAETDEAGQLIRLLRREVGSPIALRAARWVAVDAAGEKLRALTFWVGPKGLERHVRLPLPRVAEILARACGHVGSGAEYLFHTVSKLEELGIRDRNLWRLQQLVAEEIRKITPAVDGTQQLHL
jgi:cation transport protein ChaC